MITMITRADDAGSSLSANKAIIKCIKSGIIKNVSIMAVGPYVREFYRDLKKIKHDHIDFGLHAVLNAEWDSLKWKPFIPNKTLTDEKGYFLADPKEFQNTKPNIYEIGKEIEAQYQYLISLGFKIKYLDSHMLPELYVDGLFGVYSDICKKYNLIDHKYFYNLPSKEQLKNKLKGLKDGVQYFIVAHPSLDTKEMRSFGNKFTLGVDLARNRAKETKIFTSMLTKLLLKIRHIKPIKYSEAIPYDFDTIIQTIKEGKI